MGAGEHPISAFILPASGSVLGIDVGFSPKRRSSAVCRLDWTETQVTWTIHRFRDDPTDREQTIAAVAGRNPLLAAAFDGPLGPGFTLIGRYRSAEKILTHRLGPKIGKPGASNAPIGIKLNAAANACVHAVLASARVADARHAVRINNKAIFEAYPTGFLGVMLPDPALIAARRNDRSDQFFLHLGADGTLDRLTAHCLPGRIAAYSWSTVTNHDDRAALVCALAALCVSADDYTAVGDRNGWIILPPTSFTRPWARDDIVLNAARSDHTGRYHASRG